MIRVSIEQIGLLEEEPGESAYSLLFNNKRYKFVLAMLTKKQGRKEERIVKDEASS